MFYIVFTQENSLKTVYETNYNRDRDQGGIKKRRKLKEENSTTEMFQKDSTEIQVKE